MPTRTATSATSVPEIVAPEPVEDALASRFGALEARVEALEQAQKTMLQHIEDRIRMWFQAHRMGGRPS